MYNVTLLFCELYFTEPSARRFNVTFNGQQTLLSNFSVYEAAGMPQARTPSVSARCMTLLAASDVQTCSQSAAEKEKKKKDSV